jgi:hypothetical protein
MSGDTSAPTINLQRDETVHGFDTPIEISCVCETVVS